MQYIEGSSFVKCDKQIRTKIDLVEIPCQGLVQRHLRDFDGGL